MMYMLKKKWMRSFIGTFALMLGCNALGNQCSAHGFDGYNMGVSILYFCFPITSYTHVANSTLPVFKSTRTGSWCALLSYDTW